MATKKYAPLLVALITVLAIIPISFVPSIECHADSAKTLSWSIVDTPRDRNIDPSGLIAQGSEINAMAIGVDGQTIYCVDTANKKLYKSTDAGIVFTDITTSLTSSPANAKMPVWNIALAPDDPNFVVAVTDNAPGPAGPLSVFFSIDGGNTWKDTSYSSLSVNEYISCIAVSSSYGVNNEFRDVAIATRSSSAATGQVATRRYRSTGFDAWATQAGLAESITSLKFSPNYNADSTMVVVSCTGTTTMLHLGLHNTTNNSTLWDDASYGPGYPVNLTFGNWNIVIGTDLQLPSDFTASVISQQGCFVSIQIGPSVPPTPLPPPPATRLYYVNTSLSPSLYNITPPVSTSPPSRISSIAYEGTEASGILLAGEATSAPSRGMVNVWQCSNAQTSIIGGATWLKSDELKSPSGAANSGRANCILNWGANQLCYCATSSDNASVGGTGWNPAQPYQWPISRLTGAALDESALSITRNMGTTWNQINLIDTQVVRLSDVAALEQISNPTASTHPSVLYLTTVDNLTLPGYSNNFDSIWHSTSDPLGKTWERILVINIPAHPSPPSNNGDNILRVNPRQHTDSTALVFADLYTNTVIYSADSGQTWEAVSTDAKVNDISLYDDDNFYILEDYTVRRMERGAGTGGAWLQQCKVNTLLTTPAHSICTPLLNPLKTDIVIIGTGKDVPGYYLMGYVAWADFSVNVPKFTILKELPFAGNVHVIADCQFEQNKTLYAAINNAAGDDGVIYRWALSNSSDWDELDPPDRAFYGVETLNDVLYGSCNFNMTTVQSNGGADRTLYSRSRVPPAPEWDQLTYGLPASGDPNYPVKFTREPVALKISSNTYNTLWAIDNRQYDFYNKKGCLWQFVDSVARVGPQPTSPPPGSLIGTDPVSGRAQQVDFKWRQMRDVYGYEILLAKDVNFSLPLTQNLPFYPVDNLTGAWQVGNGQLGLADQLMPAAWIPPGCLESGRSYYWKVRAYLGSPTATGQIIHSPWSTAMFFSVKPGFIVVSDYSGPKLITPADGPCKNCRLPVCFSWTPMKNAKKYEFTLATDPELKDIILQTATSAAGYQYTGDIELSRPYYWQVKAVAPVISDSSPVGTFTLTPDTPTPSTPEPGQGRMVSASNFWIWIAILILFILLFLINVSIIVSRRRGED